MKGQSSYVTQLEETVAHKNRVLIENGKKKSRNDPQLRRK